ncbi:MAG: hypothetical protein LBF60_11180 [Treponema sp.]|nr:hypothetical protein [Treponema sp.]
MKAVVVVVAFERFQRWIIPADRRRTPLFASWKDIGVRNALSFHGKLAANRSFTTWQAGFP